MTKKRLDIALHTYCIEYKQADLEWIFTDGTHIKAH